MIKAIIFDFGRVISAQKPASLFQSYERELGLAPGALNRVMFGSPAWEEALLGRRTADEYWRAIGPQLGLCTGEQIDAFRRRNHADEAINPGVRDLIQAFSSRYHLAVLSNAPAGLSGWLAEWGILRFFDTVVCSGDQGIAKPDPAIFELALARLGVSPEEAVFVDDSRGHVEAARALGIRAILFTTAEELVQELDGVLRS